MKKVYDFSKQLAIGKKAEAAVKEWLNTTTLPQPIVDAPMDLQMKGVDFVAGDTTIEVKLDNYCQRNGRYFLEIELPNKPGWLWTCTADMLLLVVGGTWDMKVADLKHMRYWLEIWQRRYGVRTCENKNNYWSNGVCVPFQDLKGEVINIKEFVR